MRIRKSGDLFILDCMCLWPLSPVWQCCTSWTKRKHTPICVLLFYKCMRESQNKKFLWSPASILVPTTTNQILSIRTFSFKNQLDLSFLLPILKKISVQVENLRNLLHDLTAFVRKIWASKTKMDSFWSTLLMVR